MAAYAARANATAGSELLFELYRVPRDGNATQAELTTLKLVVGPGDEGEPVRDIQDRLVLLGYSIGDDPEGSFGEGTRAAVEEARERAAAALGCTPADTVFTSGGTEADNLALKGVVWAARTARRATARRLSRISAAPGTSLEGRGRTT